MQNEELYTALVFFDYNGQELGAAKHPAVFLRRDSVAVRIKVKADISTVWAKVSENEEAKTRWLESINRVESFLRKLKTVLIDRDVAGDVTEFLRNELDAMVRSPEQRHAVRTFQDFYFLWLILSPLNLEMVRCHRLAMKSEIRKLIQSVKTRTVGEAREATDPVSSFNARLTEFHGRYRKEDRQLQLTESQKAELIQSQKGKCPISGAPIFVGDDVAVDHKDSLATGGADSLENVQITTPEANWRKGPRPA